MKKIMIFVSLMFLVSCGTSSKKDNTSVQTKKEETSAKSQIESKSDLDTNTKFQPKVIETSVDQIQIEQPKSSYEEEVLLVYKNKNEKRLRDLITNKLAETPNDLFSLNILGANFYRKGAYKLARLVWDRALKEHRDSDTLMVNLGVTFQRDDEEKAISFYKKALKENSRNPYANYNLGSIYVKYKNYDVAEPALRLAYKELKTIESANNYALALKGNRKYKDSIKVYERIIRSNSNNYQALLNYASALVHDGSDMQKAKDLINRVRLMTDDKKILRYIKDLERRMKS